MKMYSMIAAAPWVLVLLFFTCLQSASAQPGWLSIDCGAPAPYVDDLGISWVPDDAYVAGGATATVASNARVAFAGKPVTTLRYFPDVSKTRYCYNIPVKKNQAYLMRWVAYHGGYDLRPNVQYDLSFDLFGMALSVEYTSEGNVRSGGGVFRTPKESVSFCMLRALATDNPFMSALQFVELDNTMYPGATPDTLFYTMFRIDLGAIEAQVIRYPQDPYDRSWSGYPNGELFKTVTPASVNDSGFDRDRPPPAVMNTAITTVGNTSQSMQLVLVPSFQNISCVVNLHFAELEVLTAGATRVFDISLNGDVQVPNVNILSLAQNALYKPVEITLNGTVPLDQRVVILLSATPTSTLAPLLNAVELFAVVHNDPGTFAADVIAIASVKKDLGLGKAWPGDPCMFKPYDWLQCSFGAPPRVTAVKLSKHNLTGGIPVGLRDLTDLIILELDNNMLTGPIPEWLASLSNLKELSLQNNDFTGHVPQSLLSNTLLKLRIDGNPHLCVNTTCASDTKSINVGVIAGVVAGVLLAAIAVGVTVYCCCKKSPSLGGKNNRYTLAQVMQATKNNEIQLGKGGFGPVYYGKLPCGQEVAVKVAAKDSGQGSKEFINEIELLTRVHHKHLVSLVGYCDEGKNLILIYEFMPSGTVQEHLYGVGNRERASFLDWPTRLQIALQAAQGLEYLHVGCNPSIFHRDIKSNNILLDDKMVAKVADFGLSMSTNSKDTVTHITCTKVIGTEGYLDPEYHHSFQFTEKSDVYAFGMVLLELICAKRALHKSEGKLDYLMRPFIQAGEVEKFVDKDLEGQYSLQCMLKVADLAMRSVEPLGIHRPQMSEIVQELREAASMERKLAGNMSSAFGVHNSHGGRKNAGNDSSASGVHNSHDGRRNAGNKSSASGVHNSHGGQRNGGNDSSASGVHISHGGRRNGGNNSSASGVHNSHGGHPDFQFDVMHESDMYSSDISAQSRVYSQPPRGR